MISVLVRRIMEECGLKQQELADVLGVPLARVKRLSGGTVQKWSAEEQVALADKLGISPSWLITGQGEMFDDAEDESDSEFESRMKRVMHVRAVVEALPLDDFARSRLAAVMTGDAAQDGALIAQALSASLTQPASGVADSACLSPLEAELLRNYRASDRVGKEAIERTAQALAKAMQERNS